MVKEIILVKYIKTGREYPGFIIDNIDYNYLFDRVINNIYNSSVAVAKEMIRIPQGLNALVFTESREKTVTTISLNSLCCYLTKGKDKVIIILENMRRPKKRMGNLAARKSFRNGYVRYFGIESGTTEYQILRTLKNINIRYEHDIPLEFRKIL